MSQDKDDSMSKYKRLTPYQKIMRAADRRTELLLTVEEVRQLSIDVAIKTLHTEVKT